MENNNGVASAGWHEDPEDPNYVRYSNGRTWTGERVEKKRHLTIENKSVYRPSSHNDESAAAKSVAAETTALPQQPLTRRERRRLEEALAMNSDHSRFDDEFEFQSAAPPATASYARNDNPKRVEAPVVAAPVAVAPTFDLDEEFGITKEEKESDAEEFSSIDSEAVETPYEESQEYSSIWDSADNADTEAKEEESSLPELGFSEEEDKEAEPALPELGFNEEDDFIPEKIPTTSASIFDEDEKEDETSALPSLSFGDNDEDDDVPAAIVRPEPKSEEVEETSDEDEFSFAAEDDFTSAFPEDSAPAPFAFAPPAAVASPVEEEETVAEELDLDDVLGAEPDVFVTLPEDDAVEEDAADSEEDGEEDKLVEDEADAEAPDVESFVAEDDLVDSETVDTVEEDAEVKEPVEEDAEVKEVVPAFGFRSKLNNNWGTEEKPAAETALAAQDAVPAVVEAEDETPEAPVQKHVKVVSYADKGVDEDTDDRDDEDDEEDDEPRESLAGKIKSLFARKPKPVLDEDEDEDDEYDEDKKVAKSEESGEVAPQPESSVEAPEVEAVETEAPKTEAVAVVEEVEEVAPAVVAEPEQDEVAPVAKEEEDEPEAEPLAKDEDDDIVDDEEPQLSAGLFSSRQEKEDAATEAVLLSRLKELAAKIAGLQKEELEILGRIEKAKADEKDIQLAVIKVHEEHELLDQLAATRRKEIESEHTEKEDKRFREFLAEHGNAHAELPEQEIKVAEDEIPDLVNDDLPEPKIATSFPVVVQEKEESVEEADEDEEDSPLPELKL